MSLSPITVVVVDYSAAVRVFFEKVVSTLDLDLRTYASAGAALSYLTSTQPTLLFLDIIMPDKDGLTFESRATLSDLCIAAGYSDRSDVALSRNSRLDQRMGAEEDVGVR